MVTNLLKNHGLPLTNVDIIGPRFNRENIRSHYPLAEVFFIPSRLGTWDDVILETMANGITCIGVIGQPMEEIFAYSKTDLLTAPENPHSLCHALLDLHSDRTFFRMLGIEGCSLLTKEYTWPIVARLLSNVEAVSVRN